METLKMKIEILVPAQAIIEVPAGTPVTEDALRDYARAMLDQWEAGEADLVFDEPDWSEASHATSRIVEVYAEGLAAGDEAPSVRLIVEEIQLAHDASDHSGASA